MLRNREFTQISITLHKDLQRKHKVTRRCLVMALGLRNNFNSQDYWAFARVYFNFNETQKNTRT